MKNNNLIIRVMIALATMILAGSLWILTLYIYDEYLSNIFTMQFSVLNIFIIIASNIILAILFIYLIIRLIKGLMKFMSSYTLTEGIIGIIGVIISLRIAWVMEFIFIKIPIVGNFLLVLISIILGVVGWIESIKRKDEMALLVTIPKPMPIDYPGLPQFVYLPLPFYLESPFCKQRPFTVTMTYILQPKQ